MLELKCLRWAGSGHCLQRGSGGRLTRAESKPITEAAKNVDRREPHQGGNQRSASLASLCRVVPVRYWGNQQVDCRGPLNMLNKHFRV
jgi:hypothetical protein